MPSVPATSWSGYRWTGHSWGEVWEWVRDAGGEEKDEVVAGSRAMLAVLVPGESMVQGQL
jgi:hypothetical protein